jgi:hypothetical protein
MTGTNCDLFTHKSSRSYLNHLVTFKFRNSSGILVQLHTTQTHVHTVSVFLADKVDSLTKMFQSKA